MNKQALLLMSMIFLLPIENVLAQTTTFPLVDKISSVPEEIVCVPWVPSVVSTLGLNVITQEAKKAISNNIFSK